MYTLYNWAPLSGRGYTEPAPGNGQEMFSKFKKDCRMFQGWICVIINLNLCLCPQCWAIYCLIMFYRATKHELTPIRPISKFLLIKAIVFLTYWQSLFVSFAVGLGWIKMDALMSYDANDLSAGLQEFIICIEMFVAALVFAYVFPPKVGRC